MAHPSLPNYLALVSGDTQGTHCDWLAVSGSGTCGGFCAAASCSCPVASTTQHLGDQLDTAGLSWADYGEDMGTPCNLTGGLVVVVWDEDDGSGGTLGNTDDPVPIFIASPFAKGTGYVSPVTANHYSLLATIEDGLGLPRLGATDASAPAQPLGDYFPSQ